MLRISLLVSDDTMIACHRTVPGFVAMLSDSVMLHP